mgnify:CR=1 FL=1
MSFLNECIYINNSSISNELCLEIIDPNNTFAKIHNAKVPRKQGVEKLQREFISTFHNPFQR